MSTWKNFLGQLRYNNYALWLRHGCQSGRTTGYSPLLVFNARSCNVLSQPHLRGKLSRLLNWNSKMYICNFRSSSLEKFRQLLWKSLIVFALLVASYCSTTKRRRNSTAIHKTSGFVLLLLNIIVTGWLDRTLRSCWGTSDQVQMLNGKMSSGSGGLKMSCCMSERASKN